MCQTFTNAQTEMSALYASFESIHTSSLKQTNKNPNIKQRNTTQKKILFRVSFCLTFQRVKTTCFMAAYSLIPRQNKPPEYYCNCASSVVLESYSKTFHSAVSFFLSKLNVVLFIQAHIFHSSVPSQQSNIQYSLPLLSTDAF